MFRNLLSFILGVCIGWLIQHYYRRWQKIKAITEAEKLANATSWKLKPGWAHNPALKYPPNYPCFCGTGAKFKNCCFNTLPRYVKEHRLPIIIREVAECVALVENNKGLRNDHHNR